MLYELRHLCNFVSFFHGEYDLSKVVHDKQMTWLKMPFLVGIVLSNVLFSIIDSSVCAVIVCFAGSPVEFHRNHPELSHEMRHAWKEVWPGSLDIDSVGAGLA